MGITPVQQSVQTTDAGKAVPKQTSAHGEQVAQKKDTAFISEHAKDLAAQKAGTTMQEEAKESPVVEAKEEQGG